MKNYESITTVEDLEQALKRVREAARSYASFTQEQVDRIFRAGALAANKARIPLAKLAATETGMGVAEDKVIKNHFASEYIYNAYKDMKTCGIIAEDPVYGITKIAEPIGVIAAVIPTTNPTSTAIFKALLALKTRNGVIFSPHPRAKACTIAAVLEFGRRRWGARGEKITCPGEAFSLVRHYADLRQERFICISLNGAHEVLGIRVVTVGLVDRVVVHPREVYADPITDRASAVVVAHSHPSGSLKPSLEDDKITERLRAAGELVGIHLLDHLIFTAGAYYSYSNDGKIIRPVSSQIAENIFLRSRASP
jgi:DNA repair protein RadC